MRKFKTWCRRIPALMALTLAAAVLAGCGAGSHASAVEVIVVDRSNSTSGLGGWPAEVSASTSRIVQESFSTSSEIVIESLGANVGDSAAVARASTETGCQNPNSCAEDRDLLARQLASAAGQVASTPLGHPGTDVIAAIATAKSICGERTCRIDILSDGVDSRVRDSSQPIEAIVTETLGELPKLSDTQVRITGLGANGVSTAYAERAASFLDSVLSRAGAEVSIARSR